MDPYRQPRAPVKVDCHVHLFPSRLFAAIRKWFDQVGWDIPYPYRVEELLPILSRFGIEEVWALVYAHRVGVAESLNEWMGRIASQHEMVRGFFTVHPDDENPGEVARRAVEEQGLEGLKLHAEVQDLAVDDARLDPAFDLLEARELPCVLHSADAPYPAPKDNLDVSCVERRLERNPRLRTVIAHLGANQTRAYQRLMDCYEHLYLEVSFTRFPGSAALSTIDFDALRAHRDRLLFGSDFPNVTFTYADQADSWWDIDWIREDSDAFFGARARGLLPRGR